MNQADDPVFKRIDDPWIALLALAIFILLASIVALIVLCIVWYYTEKRSQLKKKNYILNHKPNHTRQIPVYINHCQLPAYETQVYLNKF